MDFVSDSTTAGRSLGAPTLVDTYTRECLAIHADSSIPSRAVTAVLDQVIGERGKPDRIALDDGSEFTSNHFDAWAFERKTCAVRERPLADWRFGPTTGPEQEMRDGKTAQWAVEPLGKE